jgi:SAM-dependent methyltransferase
VSSAVVVDLDGDALNACRDVGGIDVRCGDVLSMLDQDATDVIFVGNFSIGYIHTRRALMRYLVASRRRLARGGIFVCDLYGGPGAWRLGGLSRRFSCENGDTIHYYWSHEAADPLSGMVENTVSFRVERAGEIVEELRDAFRYRWRLWALAELREAMLEAGFSSVEIYNDVNVAEAGVVASVRTAQELGEDWTVLICAR